MSAMQKPAPNHQSETFGSGQTQFFECGALSADHPEIQARERPENSACNSPLQQRRSWKRKRAQSSIDIPISIELHAIFLPDVRLPARGEPQRRRHVADRLRAVGVDRRRRNKDRRAGEESGELRTERPDGDGTRDFFEHSDL